MRLYGCVSWFPPGFLSDLLAVRTGTGWTPFLVIGRPKIAPKLAHRPPIYVCVHPRPARPVETVDSGRQAGAYWTPLLVFRRTELS